MTNKITHKLISAAVLAVAVTFGAPSFAEQTGMEMQTASQGEKQVEATGSVDKIMSSRNKVVLIHGPIPALKWPAMKMSFATDDDLDLSELQEGDEVRFVFEPAGGKNRIVEIEKIQ